MDMARYQSTYGAMAAAVPAPRKGFFEWIGKYWFQIFLVLLGLQIFLQKDISIRVNMRTLDGAEKGLSDRGEGAAVKALPASLKASAAPSTFSLLDQGASGMNARDASPFYYLLNPKAARKDDVPRDLLMQELDRSRKLVERFAKVALAERAKFNIPASVILAQAILGSQNGSSPLVEEANNYFEQTGEGETVTLKWNGEKVKVRRFYSAWESFRENSKTLRSGPFENLQQLPLTDYKSWAMGLQDLGFSSKPDYARSLVRLIEILDLDQFDKV